MESTGEEAGVKSRMTSLGLDILNWSSLDTQVKSLSNTEIWNQVERSRATFWKYLALELIWIRSLQN